MFEAADSRGVQYCSVCTRVERWSPLVVVMRADRECWCDLGVEERYYSQPHTEDGLLLGAG